MAQAQVSIDISGRRDGKTFPSLDKWIAHVAEVDIPKILPTVALGELQAQKAAGNDPSNILVDGRAASEAAIGDAKRRVQYFFVDVELLAGAIDFAYRELMRLYHRETGASARTIQLWGRFNRGASIIYQRIAGIDGVRDFLTAHRNFGTYVRLIGPDVPFRRRLYYSPKGGGTKFRNVNRLGALRVKELERKGARARLVQGQRKAKRRQLVQIESAVTVSEIVMKAVKAKYGSALYAAAYWIRVPVPPWKGIEKREQGVPTVAIGWKRKGAQA